MGFGVELFMELLYNLVILVLLYCPSFGIWSGGSTFGSMGGSKRSSSIVMWGLGDFSVGGGCIHFTVAGWLSEFIIMVVMGVLFKVCWIRLPGCIGLVAKALF